MTQFAASIVDPGGKADLPTEDWTTLANRLGLKIEMLQKEVAVVVISNIKVHKDHAPSDAVLPPAEQESNLRNRLNSHLTAVGKAFKESDYVDLNPFIDDVTKEITEKCQEVLKKELRGNLENLVNKSCEDMIDHKDTISKAVNEDMRRITGVVSATGGRPAAAGLPFFLRVAAGIWPRGVRVPVQTYAVSLPAIPQG